MAEGLQFDRHTKFIGNEIKINMKYIVAVINKIASVMLGIFSLHFYRKKSDKYGPIYIYRSGALGDFLFAIGGIKLLRSSFPDREIVLVNLTSGMKLVRDQVNSYSSTKIPQWVDMITGLYIDSVCQLSGDFLLDIQKLKKILRKSKDYDIVILPTPGENPLRIIKKILLFRLAGNVGLIYGSNTIFINSFFRKTQYKMGLFEHHTVQPYRSALSVAGKYKFSEKEIDCSIPCVQVEKKIINVVDRDFVSKIKNKLYVAVSIGSIRMHKKWSEENYVNVICWFLESFKSYKVIILGTESDKELSISVSAKVNNERLLNMVGETSVMELITVLYYSDFVVGNDGGALHLAAALNKKVISLIPGIEYDGSVYPWNNAELRVYGNASCAPCYSMQSCPNNTYECMSNISVDSVKKKILDCV